VGGCFLGRFSKILTCGSNFCYHKTMNQVTVEKTSKYLIVRIPLKSVQSGKAELPRGAQKVINKAINEGLEDIAASRVFGPFKNVQQFKKSLRKIS